jgi:hypothetical protein
MKRIAAIIMMVSTIATTTFAQQKQEVVKHVDKEKKTTTVGQKIHNTFSKHKHYSGTKTKHVTVKKDVKHKM